MIEIDNSDYLKGLIAHFKIILFADIGSLICLSLMALTVCCAICIAYWNVDPIVAILSISIITAVCSLLFIGMANDLRQYRNLKSQDIQISTGNILDFHDKTKATVQTDTNEIIELEVPLDFAYEAMRTNTRNNFRIIKIGNASYFVGVCFDENRLKYKILKNNC